MNQQQEIIHRIDLQSTEALRQPDVLPDDSQEIVIQRHAGWRLIDFRELWRFRELLFFLAWRDVKVRYRQAVLGAAWAVIQPLALMLVFTLFMSRLGAGSGDLPYSLLVLCGLLPWMFFAHTVNASGNSILAGQGLITKIYFPRLLIPLGAAGPALVDLAVSCSLLAVLLTGHAVFFGGVFLTWGVLLVPVILLGLLAAALGVGSLLAGLSVAYRDFRHFSPFLVQVWMFATPSIYLPAETGLSPAWNAVLPLNPVYGLVLNFRAAVVGGPLDLYALTVSLAVSFLLLAVGCICFRQIERGFADVI